MAVYLANAFSLSMLQGLLDKYGGAVKLRVQRLTPQEVRLVLGKNFTSVVGHESTAKVLSKLLETDVPTNRTQVQLGEKDALVVFQLLERLPEGEVLTEEEELGKLKFEFYMVQPWG